MPRVAIALLLTLAVLPFTAGAAGHDFTTSATDFQGAPFLTANGSGFMAAWLESSPSSYDRRLIVTGQVNAQGQTVGEPGPRIDQAQPYSMAIAHSPDETLVVWSTPRDIYAERLSPSGVLRNTILVWSSGLDISNGVSVAWNGRRYFVTWCTSSQILGAFVELDGSSTRPRPFFTEPNPATNLLGDTSDLAWDGERFAVVFGERHKEACYQNCSPQPDRFLVMRVSADGDAIDSSPAVITGNHLQAHLASSGTESLITLDSVGGVSAIVAHAGSGVLTLEPETPLFRWYAGTSSDVAWDGASYIVGWSYGEQYQWAGAARVTRSGLPFDYRSMTGYVGTPSLAVNDAGVTGMALSENHRARLYFLSELQPMPPVPSAPRNVVSYFATTFSFNFSTARIDWESDPADGFIIERWWEPGQYWYVEKTVAGNVRSAGVYASAGSRFRIRAFGAGGVLDDGPATTVRSTPRVHAQRP